LEGKTRKEAARILGLPEGTLSWRLAQAKKLLARRLSQYGAPLSVGALATLLSEGTASAVPSPTLLTATAKAGLLVASGQAVTVGTVPAQVVVLTEGVIKAMLWSKLKVCWAVGLVLAVAMSAGAGLTYQAAAQGPVQGRFVATEGAGRNAQDDLEAIRLEMEALRKEVRSARQQLKELAAEVEALKARGKSVAGPVTRPAAEVPSGTPATPAPPVLAGVAAPTPRPNPVPQATAQQFLLQALANQAAQRPNDPLADAEAALKKLRQNPNDKQATESLERALKRLKDLRRPAGGAPNPAE
jgi:hypothetical protein